MPEQQIQALSARGDALGARPAGGDAAELKIARDEYDTIAWLFAQTSSILVPLTKSRRAARAISKQPRQLARRDADAVSIGSEDARGSRGAAAPAAGRRVRGRRALEARRVQLRARDPATAPTAARAPNRDVGGRARDRRNRVRHGSELLRDVRRPAHRRRRRCDAERARVDRRVLLPGRQIRPARRRSRSDRERHRRSDRLGTRAPASDGARPSSTARPAAS